MKTIYTILAAVSALAVTAPLAAQPGKDNGPAPRSWSGDRHNTYQLQAQFDAGVQTGAISRREAQPLRVQLRQLAQMERQYARGGFSGWERSALRERSRTLSMNLVAAERSGNARFGVRSDLGADIGAGFGMNDRGDNRGDRFRGDLRVGQHFSGRQVALPIQYRERYRDSDASYYRYDDDRVYQIDRDTGLILAMFDIGS